MACINTDDALFELQHLAANCPSTNDAGLSFTCRASAPPPSLCGPGHLPCDCSFTYSVNGHNYSSGVVSPPANPIYSDEVTLLLIAAAFVACVKFVIK